MVDCQHYFFFIDLEMIKNFCKSDTMNGHHNNVNQALSQLVVLRKKRLKRVKKFNMKTRDSCSYRNEHMKLNAHAECPNLVQCHKSHLHKFSIQLVSVLYK